MNIQYLKIATIYLMFDEFCRAQHRAYSPGFRPIESVTVWSNSRNIKKRFSRSIFMPQSINLSSKRCAEKDCLAQLVGHTTLTLFCLDMPSADAAKWPSIPPSSHHRLATTTASVPQPTTQSGNARKLSTVF